VPAHQRSKPAHYKGSGFDRGHLAPAGDMRSDEAMNDSFRLSNVSPQVGNGFNR
jgi:endonuclease G